MRPFSTVGLTRSLFGAALLLTSTGCVGALGRVPDPFAEGPAAGNGSIQVAVENQNFADAHVFALRRGERIRLGLISGKSDANLELDWNFAVPLRFEVQLVAGSACSVREVTVDPGDRVWVRIPGELSITPCAVGKR